LSNLIFFERHLSFFEAFDIRLKKNADLGY